MKFSCLGTLWFIAFVVGMFDPRQSLSLSRSDAPYSRIDTQDVQSALRLHLFPRGSPNKPGRHGRGGDPSRSDNGVKGAPSSLIQRTSPDQKASQLAQSAQVAAGSPQAGRILGSAFHIPPPQLPTSPKRSSSEEVTSKPKAVATLPASVVGRPRTAETIAEMDQVRVVGHPGPQVESPVSSEAHNVGIPRAQQPAKLVGDLPGPVLNQVPPSDHIAHTWSQERRMTGPGSSRPPAGPSSPRTLLRLHQQQHNPFMAEIEASAARNFPTFSGLPQPNSMARTSSMESAVGDDPSANQQQGSPTTSQQGNDSSNKSLSKKPRLQRRSLYSSGFNEPATENVAKKGVDTQRGRSPSKDTEARKRPASSEPPVGPSFPVRRDR